MPNILLQFETIKNVNAGQGRIRSNNNSHTSFVDLEPRVFSMEPNLWVGSGCEHFNLSNFDVLQTMIIFLKKCCTILAKASIGAEFGNNQLFKTLSLASPKVLTPQQLFQEILLIAVNERK